MAEITKSDAEAPMSESNYIKIVLGILAVFTYFFGLTVPFLGPDEARYAQVAREMFERGDWITPTLGGFNWFEKPALLYWLEIASYHVFGVSEFAARFGPAIFGLGTVFSLWLLGRSLTSIGAVPKSFPTTIALVASSTLGIVAFAHGASFDIIVTFPITAAMAGFFVWHFKNESNSAESDPAVSSALVLFYVFIGMALLAKGLIGAVFPLAIVTFYYSLSRKLPSRVFIISLFWGALLSLAIAATWYVPMYLRHGYEFIDEFFVQHHFQRFTSNKYQHPQPSYFFFLVLPLMTLPWLPFFIGSVWTFVRSLLRRHDAADKLSVSSKRLLIFSAAWILVPLVFFSFSGSKLPGYILPAVPAAVVFAAVYLSRLGDKGSRWPLVTRLIALSVFIGTIILQLTVMPYFAATDSVKALVRSANERGYSSERILAYYSVSHNAEFYAVGRLIRDEQGRQRAFYSVEEVVEIAAAETNRRILVLVKLRDMNKLTTSGKISTELIGDNTEYAIVAVTPN
ncbi:MAG: glycosyltransferase family 39 protein [Acidobacteria bacterium]|nr:glycosyltransferase family 39 protein [Acidobacteriota bacterium]